MIEKGLEQKSHRVKGIQENFEKGYVKVKKKKKWKWRRMPINSKRGKKRFQWKKDTTNAKSQHQKKSSFMSFGVSRIKPLVSSKVFRSIIHHRKSWIYIMTYVKRILIFEINKVICHFLHNDKRKRVDE